MFIETRKARPSRDGGISRSRSNSHALLAGAMLICTTQPLKALPEAANPETPVAPAKYRPAIEGYVPFRPVEPRDWQGVNREVAPQPPAEPKERDTPR